VVHEICAAYFGDVLQAVREAKCLGISVLFSIFFGQTCPALAGAKKIKKKTFSHNAN
jgi:hypothetical protein